MRIHYVLGPSWGGGVPVTCSSSFSWVDPISVPRVLEVRWSVLLHCKCFWRAKMIFSFRRCVLVRRRLRGIVHLCSAGHAMLTNELCKRSQREFQGSLQMASASAGSRDMTIAVLFAGVFFEWISHYEVRGDRRPADAEYG